MSGSEATSKQGPAPTLAERVEQVLDLIRPSIQSDGGDIEFVGLEDNGVVWIRLHGACVGCPSSLMTLRMGIEKNLRDNIEEVTAVRAAP